MYFGASSRPPLTSSSCIRCLPFSLCSAAYIRCAARLLDCSRLGYPSGLHPCRSLLCPSLPKAGVTFVSGHHVACSTRPRHRWPLASIVLTSYNVQVHPVTGAVAQHSTWLSSARLQKHLVSTNQHFPMKTHFAKKSNKKNPILLC